jgi:hypothetical protein
MVNTSDFIAFCLTNAYGVGTPHEIIVARNEGKPVLFVSPPVTFPSLAPLLAHLANELYADGLLKAIIKNKGGTQPARHSLARSLFDGFGSELYSSKFQWRAVTDLEKREQNSHPRSHCFFSFTCSTPRCPMTGGFPSVQISQE